MGGGASKSKGGAAAPPASIGASNPNPGPFPHVKAMTGMATVANNKKDAGLPNEDRAVVEEVRRAVYMYSVIDGHKGPMCADFLQSQLHESIKKQPGMEPLADELRDPRQALMDGYYEADVAFLKQMDAMERQVVMVDGTEIDITADLRNSGSTGCTALIVGNELFVANVGDSRCVLCRSGLSLNLTNDHNPDSAFERQRVEAAGAMIIRNRVYGDLAVTRSFGDRGFKFTKEEGGLDDDEPGASSPLTYINDPHTTKSPLTAMAEIEVHTIKPVDEFLVLATDGLWVTMTNMEVVTFVHEFFANPPTAALRMATDDVLCEQVATELTEEAVRRRKTNHDDITVVVVKLQMKEVGKTFLMAPPKV